MLGNICICNLCINTRYIGVCPRRTCLMSQVREPDAIQMTVCIKDFLQELFVFWLNRKIIITTN